MKFCKIIKILIFCYFQLQILLVQGQSQRNFGNFSTNIPTEILIIAHTGNEFWAYLRMEKNLEKYKNFSTYHLIDGFSKSILQDLEFHLNFTYKIIGDSVFLSQNKDGHWSNTLSEQILRNNDQNMPILTITPQIYKSFLAQEFTLMHPVISKRVYAFFNQPKHFRLKTYYLDAFDLSVWLSIVGIYALFLLYIILIQIRRQTLHLFRTFFELLGIISGQSCHLKNKLGHELWILTLAIVTSMLIFQFYSGIILYRLFSDVNLFSSFEALIKNHFKFCVFENSSSMKEFIKGLIENLKLDQKEFYINNTLLINITLNSKFAVLFYPDTFLQKAKLFGYSEEKYCQLINSLPVERIPSKSGFLTSLWSPIKEPVNQKLLKLVERGFIHKYKKIYDEKTEPHCMDNYDLLKYTYQEINLEDDVGIFSFYAILLISSWIILVLERFLKNYSKIQKLRLIKHVQ